MHDFFGTTVIDSGIHQLPTEEPVEEPVQSPQETVASAIDRTRVGQVDVGTGLQPISLAPTLTAEPLRQSDVDSPEFGKPEPAADVSQKKPANARAAFRNQVLRELVTEPFRDEQQQTSKIDRSNGKPLPIYCATDTEANTIFHRLGVVCRILLKIRSYVNTEGKSLDNFPFTAALNTLSDLLTEANQRAYDGGPLTWCKSCGEEINDCHCSIPHPRQGK